MHKGLALFRKEAVAHRRQKVNGAVFLSRPVSATAVTVTLAAITVAAVAFLSVYEFQRRETVKGHITSSAGVVALRARNGGVLTKLFVELGDAVAAGDPLFAATTDLESTSGLTKDQQFAATGEALKELARQSGLVSETFAARRERLQDKRQALAARIERLRQQVDLQEQLLELAEQNLRRVRRLHTRQHASEHEVTRSLERVLEQRAGVARLQADIVDRQSEARDVALELDRLPNARARELSDLKLRRSSMLQTRLELGAQRDYLVRAPVAGRVSAVAGHAGQQLTAQKTVVTVLPEGARLVANLAAPSRAVGFLEVNGPVNLLIDAFPYQKFGVQRGRIREIAKTAQRPGELELPFAHSEAAYKLVVELEHDYVLAYGKQYPLKVDMTLRGDLIVDRRSLLDWLLEPLRAVRL